MAIAQSVYVYLLWRGEKRMKTGERERERSSTYSIAGGPKGISGGGGGEE